MGQTEAPVVGALRAYKKQGTTSFGVPGHKSGVGATADVKRRLLGPDVFAAASTTQKGIDDRRGTKRVVQRAGELAAEAWGAAQAHLSANGTGLSNHIAFLRMARPGDTVPAARHVACFRPGLEAGPFAPGRSVTQPNAPRMVS